MFELSVRRISIVFVTPTRRNWTKSVPKPVVTTWLPGNRASGPPADPAMASVDPVGSPDMSIDSRKEATGRPGDRSGTVTVNVWAAAIGALDATAIAIRAVHIRRRRETVLMAVLSQAGGDG